MADMNNNSGANSGSILTPAENLTNPRDYKAPAKDNAQSRGTTNAILNLSEDQIFNNASQGKGIAGPAVWGGPDGEKGSQSSAEAGSSAGSGGSVDLTSGQNSCWNGGRAYKG